MHNCAGPGGRDGGVQLPLAQLSRGSPRDGAARHALSRGRRAAADAHVAGADPNPAEISAADPARLTAEPYTGGWLFEGVPAPETTLNLLQGAAARQWMEQEQHRINQRSQ